MKSPEQIKKGLECCQTDMTTKYKVCGKCGYFNNGFGCENTLMKEALAYIHQLERERDAAVEDMTEAMRGSEQCTYCKYLSQDDKCTRPMHELGGMCWEWRGAQEVE